jgi:diacylglycerol kinase family enzyme
MGAYVLAGLDAFARYPNPGIEVQLDDGRTDRGSFVLVSNTKLYGAYFVFQPSADPTDGLLDVFVFRDTGRWKFLGMVAQLVWHNLTSPRSPDPPAFLARHGVYKVSGLRILPGHDRAVQADGEFLDGGVTSIKVSPGALTVMLPKSLLRWKGRP